MKKHLTFLAIATALFSCGDSTNNKVEEKPLTLDIAKVSYDEKSEECETKGKAGCAALEASYDVLKNQESDSLNNSLKTVNDSIYGQFAKAFIEFIPEGNLQLNDDAEKLIGSFFKKHRKDQAEYEELIGYELINNVKVAYYTNDFVSIDQTIMTYAGGAHPNTAILYKTLDMKSGNEINTQNWLADTVALKADILAKIKQHMKMDQTVDLEEKGFFITDQELFVSNQLLITADSVSFMYNSYELAPYSFGNFNITLSKDVVKMNN